MDSTLTQQTVQKTVMFADIAGSTKLYEQLGDTEARKLIAQTLSLMTEITAQYQGHVIKTIGDEIMCAFDEPDHAVATAMTMQEKIPQQSTQTSLQVRIGLHCGEVIEKDGDLFGDTVNVAARMTTIANAGQIITTEETMHHLSPQWALYGRAYDRTHVKGKQQAINIFQLTADSGEETVMLAPDCLQDITVSSLLILRYQGQDYRLDGSQSEFLIGRDSHNDMVILSPKVSRIHGTITIQRGKFVFNDNSTNGSYIQPREAAPIYLRREQGILVGEGKICLGHSCDTSPEETTLHYRVEH